MVKAPAVPAGKRLLRLESPSSFLAGTGVEVVAAERDLELMVAKVIQ